MSVVIDPLKALEIWREATVAGVKGNAPDLSARQMAVLLTVYGKKGPHTVKGLAEELNIAKPAVTRALDKLSMQGFIKRKRDKKDMRNVFIERTVKGSVYLRNFGDSIVKAADAVS